MPSPAPWPRWLLLLLGVSLSGALTWLLFRSLGITGVLIAAPVWGAVLAWSLVDGMAEVARLARWLAWRQVAGRYFEHRGRWIDIVEDAGGLRYVRLAHVRRILPDLPSDASFAQRYAGRLWPQAPRPLVYLHDEALLDYLLPAQTPEALRLRHWLERQVILPGRKARELRR